MVEEAVEEILDLVRKAAETFKSAQGCGDFDFPEGKLFTLIMKI